MARHFAEKHLNCTGGGGGGGGGGATFSRQPWGGGGGGGGLRSVDSPRALHFSPKFQS